MSGGPSILVAPDSFKGTMSAAVVAEAVAAGVRNAGGNVDLCPVADGGEGTLEALRGAVGGHLVRRLATGPDGQRVEACYLLSRDGDSAVIETAAASGLHLVDPERVDAWAATSAGTGELLSAAASAGARHLLLGVGGSGCTDGGLGALSAIAEAGGLHGARLTVLCDVVTPYEEAARSSARRRAPMRTPSFGSPLGYMTPPPRFPATRADMPERAQPVVSPGRCGRLTTPTSCPASTRSWAGTTFGVVSIRSTP